MTIMWWKNNNITEWGDAAIIISWYLVNNSSVRLRSTKSDTPSLETTVLRHFSQQLTILAKYEYEAPSYLTVHSTTR